MAKAKKLMMLSALAVIVLLILLSIYASFIGQVKAQALFNSRPMQSFWLVFFGLLIASLIVFRQMLKSKALLLIHVGAILLLAGSFLASETGHKAYNVLFSKQRLRSGLMLINEGQTSNAAALDNQSGFIKLPFSLHLDDFNIEYYQPGTLVVDAGQGQRWELPAETGNILMLSLAYPKIEILRTFRNFKISIDDNKRAAYDDLGPSSNPAIEVKLTHPDGTEYTEYIFEKFPVDNKDSYGGLKLTYYLAVKDYVSNIKVIQDEKTVAAKKIEVNKPLHYGGYYFYQSSYDEKAGQYTILSVSSDLGLGLVFGGYLFLAVGVFWQLWFKKALFQKEIS